MSDLINLSPQALAAELDYRRRLLAGPARRWRVRSARSDR